MFGIRLSQSLRGTVYQACTFMKLPGMWSVVRISSKDIYTVLFGKVFELLKAGFDVHVASYRSGLGSFLGLGEGHPKKQLNILLYLHTMASWFANTFKTFQLQRWPRPLPDNSMS